MVAKLFLQRPKFHSHHTLMIRRSCKTDEGTGYLAMVQEEVVVEV